MPTMQAHVRMINYIFGFWTRYALRHIHHTLRLHYNHQLIAYRTSSASELISRTFDRKWKRSKLFQRLLLRWTKYSSRLNLKEN
ncbi:unnamed protein product [Cyberlindnera jadinii]|uniref:Uncharacterized protein n=1 Tax=Cyberlindnera jadinii (strain ATCC 18201 / CBS 1600 / BCRC 20928 / JCM 3617 / NBRC 0987 / NRRL Y-1542) TaxID=983966 RepID=A0A0H5C341_CYBJN|nr:unnamed protein product [Cyberlindnera jadinii]